MRRLASAGAGLVFGLGLLLSGMTNPVKVQNFLDIFGVWDPSLAFVMGGAITVTAIGYALLRRTQSPLFGPSFHWPTRRDIDRPLVLGAALFGIGWGLAGLCPGPALTMVTSARADIGTFVVAMLLGFAAARWYLQSRTRGSPDGAVPLQPE